MKYEECKRLIHVRSAMYRKANPSQKYWKNDWVPLDERVPDDEKRHSDWMEYDPRDDDECSLFMSND